MAKTFSTDEVCEAVRKLHVTDARVERYFRVMTSPIIDDNGEICAGITLYEDTTDLSKALETFEQL